MSSLFGCYEDISMESLRLDPRPDLAPEICWQIFDKMSPLDRIRLSRVSRSWRAAFEPYHLHLLSKFLLRYFSSPAEFRALQKRTGMVISGSAAIQVLVNKFWEESDLDLYVEHKNVVPVAAFVLSQGYDFQPSEIQIKRADGVSPSFQKASELVMDYDFTGIAAMAVYTFAQGTRKVQVISTRCPVLRLILMFHSTVVMNLITHSTIYALYPHASFQSHLNLHLTSRIGDQDKKYMARMKYEERGWRDVPALYPYELLHTPYRGVAKRAFCLGARWLGDNLTLSIQLDGLSPSLTPRDSDFDSWTLDSSATHRLVEDIPVRLTTAILKLPSSKQVCLFDEKLAEALTKIMPALQEMLGCSEEAILREVVPFYCRRRQLQTSVLDTYASEDQRIIIETITTLAALEAAKERERHL
ncbi:hypothetical protein DFH08DRAFT_847675 [Mycena albidolilacea]|uniref:F-box domain-containing protein n=1 Tax=Mycena albidolilacea TaxID=1033008 RepID=A0AAD7EXP5_9AGAR|nr:hypothetical protein DFH08DRAFT_847675 [Mycena albidolilacea]